MFKLIVIWEKGHGRGVAASIVTKSPINSATATVNYRDNRLNRSRGFPVSILTTFGPPVSLTVHRLSPPAQIVMPLSLL